MPSGLDPHTAALTQSELLRLVRERDPRGLAALYDRHAPRMLRVAWRLTSARADAEDVVHDVFLRIPELLARYDERGTLDAWLAQVTARSALMRLRSDRRRHALEAQEVISVVGVARTDLAAEYGDLERLIAALPESQRTVFVLREIEGFSHDEIAALVGISAGASRVRLTRALESLRRSLSRATPIDSVPVTR
jgi:RNA polymerase sigma-70 factor, ECF subfamily